MLLYLLITVGLFGMFFIFIYRYKEFELLIYMELLVCVFMLIKLRNLFFDELMYLILGIIVLIVR